MTFTKALFIFLVVQFVRDVLTFYKRSPVLDAFCVLMCLGLGMALLKGNEPDTPPSDDGWIFIGIAVAWALFMFLRPLIKSAKDSAGTPPGKDEAE